MDEPLLDTHQVAARLNISRSYVYFLLRVGDIPCIRIGRTLRVHPGDLRRYLKRRGAPRGSVLPMPPPES